MTAQELYRISELAMAPLAAPVNNPAPQPAAAPSLASFVLESGEMVVVETGSVYTQTSSGQLADPSTVAVSRRDGGYKVVVPHGSAALLTIPAS